MNTHTHMYTYIHTHPYKAKTNKQTNNADPVLHWSTTPGYRPARDKGGVDETERM